MFWIVLRTNSLHKSPKNMLQFGITHHCWMICLIFFNQPCPLAEVCYCWFSRQEFGNPPDFEHEIIVWKKSAQRFPKKNLENTAMYNLPQDNEIIPSRELTLPKALLKMIFLFPWWDMLISWRVFMPKKSKKSAPGPWSSPEVLIALLLNQVLFLACRFHPPKAELLMPKHKGFQKWCGSSNKTGDSYGSWIFHVYFAYYMLDILIIRVIQRWVAPPQTYGIPQPLWCGWEGWWWKF